MAKQGSGGEGGRRGGQGAGRRAGAALGALMLAALVAQLAAQLPTADDSIARDRAGRQAAQAAGRALPATPKRGFFGTVFHLVLDQANDTKSAYSQISNLVNDQFSDGEEPKKPAAGGNGTEAPTKVSRAEFLRIIDRNLKGLRRLRDLEWREALKDSRKNIRVYQVEAQKGKYDSGR